MKAIKRSYLKLSKGYRSEHGSAIQEKTHAIPKKESAELKGQARHSMVQNFSFGPRNCIGKYLAWAEMRLVLARMVWTFDISAAAVSMETRRISIKRRRKLGCWWRKNPFVIVVSEC